MCFVQEIHQRAAVVVLRAREPCVCASGFALYNKAVHVYLCLCCVHESRTRAAVVVLRARAVRVRLAAVLEHKLKLIFLFANLSGIKKKLAHRFSGFWS